MDALIDTRSDTDLIDSVLDALAATAIVGPRGATWCEPVAVEAGNPAVHRTGDATLYQGSAGVGLALAIAAATLDRPSIAVLARDALDDALGRVDEITAPGLYDGRAGIGLAALSAGHTLGDDALAHRGAAVLRDVVAGGGSPGAWDLISGDAGIAVALTSGWRLCGDDALLAGAVAAVRRLGSAAIERCGGRAWLHSGETWLPLTGLAHGTAGVSHACSVVATAIAVADRHPTWFGRDVSAIIDLGEAALRHERAWYDPVAQAWPDLRAGRPEGCGDGVLPALWCHGAVGTGLVLLDRFARTHDPLDGAWAAAALQKVCTDTIASVRNGDVGHGLTLCHGTAGAVELLLAAHRVFGEPEHLRTAQWIAEQSVAVLGTDVESWPTGIAGARSSAGLMTGLAGTLLSLLRLADPGRVQGLALLGADGSVTIGDMVNTG